MNHEGKRILADDLLNAAQDSRDLSLVDFAHVSRRALIEKVRAIIEEIDTHEHAHETDPET